MSYAAISLSPIAPPPIAPPMLLETQRYTDALTDADPDATTDSFDRDDLAALVEETRSPNRRAREIVARTWPHAKVRRTEVILDRRGFRRAWRRQRDEAVAMADIGLAATATMLVDAVDRLAAESLVACLCDVDGQTWEMFVDTETERLVGARQRQNIW